MIGIIKQWLGIQRDWRDLRVLPKEIIPKRRLDKMEKTVVDDLKKIQDEEVTQHHLPSSAKPQALFYYHKYIDAKFNKWNFDIDRLFSDKQNIIDEMYAQGLGELNIELVNYQKQIKELKEAEQRMCRKLMMVDPEAESSLELSETYNDADELVRQILSLPHELNWKKLITDGVKNDEAKA